MGDIFLGGVNPNADDLGAQDVGINTTTGQIFTASGALPEMRVGSNGVAIHDVASDSGDNAVVKVRNSQGGGQLITGGGNVSVQQTTGAGVWEKDWINFTRNAGVALRYDGEQKMVTHSRGIEVQASDITELVVHNTGTNDPALMDVRNNAGSGRTWVGTSGQACFGTADANGNNQQLAIQAFRSSGTRLYYSGTDRFQTLSNGAGAISSINESMQLTARNDIRGININCHSNGTVYFNTTDGAGADGHSAISINHAGKTTLHYDNAPRIESTVFGATVTRGLTDRVNLSVVNTDGGTTVWFQSTTVHHSHATSDGSTIRDYLYSSERGATVLNHGSNGFGSVVTTSTGGNLNGTWTGTLSGSSDKRLKKNIRKIENPLQTMLALDGHIYDKESELGKGDYRTEMGVIADEVEPIVPELVHTAEEGDKLKSVFYGNGFALTIEAFKELTEVLGKQQTYIEKLEERIATLEAQK